MRIVIMTDSYLPTIDGVVTAVLVTRRCLEALGHKVFIVAPDPGPEFREEGVYYFRAVKLRTYSGYYVPLFPSNKVELLKQLKPDIIHVRGVAFMAEKALIAGHELGIPVVITYDTAVTEVVDQYSPIKLPKNTLRELTKRYLKIMLGRSDAVIVPTESIEKELLNSIGVQPKKIAVIPTGIDTEKFSKTDAGAALREKYGLTGKRILLYVGRLSVEKNLPLLIRALHELPEDIHLLIVGSGPSRDELEGLVEELGLDERVTFVGYLHDQDLVDHYSCADSFVSPSMFETQGFTVQEAMSCGLPVACARARAYAQLVKDG